MLKFSQVDYIVQAYKTLAKIPQIFGGKLNNYGNRVTSQWLIRNLDRGKRTKYVRNFVLDEKLSVVCESEFGADVSNVLLSAVSPQETFKAVICVDKGSATKKQYLEVWSRNTLAHAIDLTALDLHGDVYADAEFGNLDWSCDESALVYVAEKKLPKSEPYIKRKPAENKPDCWGDAAPNMGEQHVYKEDWGEEMEGKHLSVIVVCRLDTETFTVLEGLPESWCPGQVHFTPDGQGVVGVAFESEPSRLGLVLFCTNRPSYIFELSFNGILKILSSEGMAVRSPRFTPTGDLVWLQRPAFGPHNGCHAIVIKRGDMPVTPVVDIIPHECCTLDGSTFTGAYCLTLPPRAFASNNRLFFCTPQKYDIRSYLVDLDGGRIVDISNKSCKQSTSILDVSNDVVLAACSNMQSPCQLYVARLPPPGFEAQIQWLPVTQPNEVPESVRDATIEYLQLEHPGSADAVRFATLQINYRGSTGAGQATIDFLVRRIGDCDVKDCKLATDVALQNYPIDENKIGITGGSHGGFLVAHLSGQYPDLYRAVVTRNPVTDMASMINSTDIPDWCAAEAGYEFTEHGPVSEEQLLAMRRCSPFAYVHQVKAPTALMLGVRDRRVPRYQGLEYARRLKANGVKVRVYMYDDNHSLLELSSEMDNMINGMRWFIEHLYD